MYLLVNENTKLCSFCGKNVTAEDAFCNNCGASLTEEVKITAEIPVIAEQPAVTVHPQYGQSVVVDYPR
jgi:predicted amidophosphoribosyltransferase